MAKKIQKKRKSVNKNSHLKKLNYALAGLALGAIFGLGYYSYTQLSPNKIDNTQTKSKNQTQKENLPDKKEKELIGKPLEPIKHKKYEFDKNENLSKIFFKDNKDEQNNKINTPKQEKQTPKNESKEKETEKISVKQDKETKSDKEQKQEEEPKKELEIKSKTKQTSQIQKNYPNYIKPPNKFLPSSKKTQPIIHLGDRPRLVIIIDDVATKAHAEMVRSIGLKITPSIFPATKAHPDTPQIANRFSTFMIHLPLEAIKFNKPEPNTLKDSDSYEKINNTIKKIRLDFPNAKYINNHTGSKFTSSEEAMIKLLRSTLVYDFTFLDSRTTQYSKVANASEKLGLGYIGRDVFLDDDESADSVKKELEKAVSIAKKRGYAIAIGHPKPNTINTIKSQKNRLLKDVEVVYFSELYH